MNAVLGIAGLLIVAKAATELLLARLNRQEALANSGRVPDAFAGSIDPATYQQSIQYTLAKNNLGQFETIFDALVLAIILMTGVLPWFYGHWTLSAGHFVWTSAAFL